MRLLLRLRPGHKPRGLEGEAEVNNIVKSHIFLLQRNMMTMLSILSQLPRTIVLLLQPGDWTKIQTFPPNRGFICDFFLST